MKTLKYSLIFYIICCFSFHRTFAQVQFTQEDRDRLIRTETRVEQMEKRIVDNFEQVDYKFVQSQKQMDELKADIRWYFGIIVGALFMLFGFILWDRRTFIKPFQNRVEEIDLELAKEKGKTKSLTQALRDLAKTDVKLAEILKTHNLL